jgi:5-methylcytosine-specific restriction endonuclease McrA
MGSGITRQVANARRRARKQGLSADLTVEAWQATLEDFDFCCAYCRMYCCGLRSFATIEHYISLAAGGGTCIDNCIPSCPSCNSLKGSLLPEQVPDFSPERVEQIRRYLHARQKGKRKPEYLCTPIVTTMRKRECLMTGMEDLRQSEQRLGHGEKIALYSASQQIVLKVSNTSENLLHAPSYEIGVALTVQECITLARDLLCAAVSPSLSSSVSDTTYQGSAEEEQGYSWNTPSYSSSS